MRERVASSNATDEAGAERLNAGQRAEVEIGGQKQRERERERWWGGGGEEQHGCSF